MNNDQLDFLDIITILSFILQIQNNDELHRQTSNDEILKRLHEDVMNAIEDNREMCQKIMDQNEEIIHLLKGEQHERIQDVRKGQGYTAMG